MFGGFFDMDKPFWRWMGKIPEIILLSLLWYLCSIPLITIIPASCALFDAVSRNLMMDDKGCYKRFFRSFLRELKQGIPLSIFWLLIGYVAIYGVRVVNFYAATSSTFSIFSILYLIMIVMMVGYLGWLVALQSRYGHTFIKLHINALRFFLGRLPGSAGMIISTIGIIVVCLISPRFTLWLTAFAPCLIAIFHTIPVEKAFQRAFPQDYEDGLPVYTEQYRTAIRAIKKARKEEAEAQDAE